MIGELNKIKWKSRCTKRILSIKNFSTENSFAEWKIFKIHENLSFMKNLNFLFFFLLLKEENFSLSVSFVCSTYLVKGFAEQRPRSCVYFKREKLRIFLLLSKRKCFFRIRRVDPLAADVESNWEAQENPRNSYTCPKRFVSFCKFCIWH